VVKTVVRVDVGAKLPQAPGLPQVTVQLTPAASFVVAEKVEVTLVFSVDGTPTRETVIGATTAVIVIVADADFVVSFTEVAVIVTVFPVGTAAGAV
jgi:hypothetical protein